MDEARSLTYSINVEANTSQAEASIRNITSNLGGLAAAQSTLMQIRLRLNRTSEMSQAVSVVFRHRLGPSVRPSAVHFSTASTAATASRPPYAPA